MSLSSSRAELLSRADSRSPARAIASGGEGRGARPRAADEQLVGGGQGVCALPRVERGACKIGGEVRAGRRERGYEARQRRHARGPTQGWGPGHARRAHLEHAVHGRDAGGVPAQRLVEGRRLLPSRRERACDAGGERCEPRRRRERAWGVVVAHKRHARRKGRERARLKAWGPRARAERTKNISRMSVTLEVSKLSGWLKADAPCRVEGRACDAGGRGASREGGGPGVVAAHTRHARGSA